MKIVSSGVFTPLLCLALLAGCNSSAPETAASTRESGAANVSDSASSPDGAQAESAAASQTERVKPAAGKGNVQGRVLYNDLPAKNIEVKLHEKFSSFLGASGKSYEARTGADGYYVIKNVPPGKYEGLTAKVFDTDSVVFMQSGILKSKEYEIASGKTLFVDDTNLFKSDLKISAPKAAATVAGKNVEIKWQSYPAATYYKLSLSAADYKNSPNIYEERIEGNSYKVAKPLPKDEYTLNVKAYNSKDHKLAESPQGFKFRVAP